ncbi:MAG TPA: hypothetical protein VFI97_05870, partial [Arthrobacter sp.]|nr:hypothetical protein [Arthrobacter sp.]
MGAKGGMHWRSAAGRIATLSLLGLVVFLPQVAWGADEPSVNPYEEYGKRINAAQQVAPMADSAFGDQVSLYNGATTFRVKDVSLPGNSALGVAVSRELQIQDQRKIPEGGGALHGFADWSLDVPYVWGTFTAQNGWTLAPGGATNRCNDNVNGPYTQVPYASGGSVLVPTADIWGGNLLHVPGSGDQQMLANTEAESPAYPSRSAYKWVTTGNWKLKCIASVPNLAGEGFVAVSPSGVSYTFNYAITVPTSQLEWQYQSGPSSFAKIKTDRVNVYLLATHVKDRFGNWVNYNYSTVDNHIVLNSITADSSAGGDARSITLNWSGDRVTSVTSAMGTWSYAYGTSSWTNKAGVTITRPYLTTVTRPDGSKWHYTINSGSRITNKEDFPYDDVWPPNHCQIMPLPNSGSLNYTIGAPSGASATYSFTYSRHRRTYVPKGCLNNSDPNLHYPLNATDYFDNFYLTEKQVSGPGLATATWTYTYHDDPSPYGIGGYFTASSPWIDIAASQPYEPPGTCDTCPVGKVVTVTGPAEITKSTYGTQYARNEGQLLQQDVTDLNGNLLQSTTYTYVSDAQAPGEPFPDIAGHDLRPNYIDPMGNRNRPASKTVIARDGATFTTAINSFDAYARATQQTESSVMGPNGYSRVKQTTYHDDPSLWVLGQIAESRIAGIVAAQTSYTDKAQPLEDKRFGKLVSTNAWNADGTLHSITDGRGKETTLSNWYRGLPRTVTFGDDRTEQATVNSAGWITSVTDEKGYATSYGYDAMGRLASITYPTGDDVAWNKTLLSFTPSGSGEYGTPVGTWVQTVQTGSGVTNVYFDALWRPLVSEHFDSGNKAATLSQTVQRYDAKGREIFKSYPVNNLGNYASAGSGFHTDYDALNRVTGVQQDSELGSLPTTTQYLPGFQTRVTDARGNATVTSYQAYGEPTTERPDSITGPVGSLTVIMRDPFGKPLSITRTGTTAGSPQLTRSFVYDANQQLCKRIEPETGATAFGYDGAGNLVWSAAGLSLPNDSSCDVSAAFGSGRRVDRTYDDRNRITSITYEDGMSSASFGYDLDGALLTQTQNNDTNLVTTTYAYDRRRLLIAETVSLPGSAIYSIGYGYDANGHLASNTWPDGRAVTYSPNALGQPTRAGTYATGATYYPSGALASFTYGNGLVHTMTQNARQLPERSQDSYAAVAVHDDRYDYDGVGNVKAITDYVEGSPGDRNMTYDGLNRLTKTVSQWFGGDNQALYSYDVLDNLRSARVGNHGSFNYGYDAAGTNRLVALTDPATGTVLTSFAYDVQGNLARKGAQTYQFDQANRLRDVPGVASYLYDAAGRRVRKNETASARVLDTVYSRSGHLMYQWDAATQNSTDYVYLGGSLVARVEHNYIKTPTLSGPSSSASGTFTLSWTAEPSATRYQLNQSKDGGSASVVYNSTGNSWSSSALGNGSYAYHVYACNAAGCSDASNGVTVAVTHPPASAPSLSGPTSSSSGSYTLSWTAVSGATRYQLNQSVNGGAWTSVYNSSGRSWSSSNVGNGSYAYRVYACNVGGCSAASSTVTVQVLHAPTAPSLSGPSTSANGTFTLSWTAVSGATRYQLNQSKDGGTNSVVYNSTSRSWSSSALGNGSYAYHVYACNSAGCSAASNAVTVVVTHPPASAPSLSGPSSSSSGTYTLTWTAVSGATRYQLNQSKNGATPAAVYNSSGRSWSSSNVGNGSYAYQVYACNVGGCSAASNKVTVVVTHPPASAPTLSGPSSSASG